MVSFPEPAVTCSECGSGQACCRPLPTPCNRVSVRAEALLWWSDDIGVPALVTTSTPGTAPGSAGVLGEAATSVLFGNSRLNSDVHSGGRITLDYWLSPCRTLGLEATYLGIAEDTTRFRETSQDQPILARPYFDTATGAQAAMLIAHPDFLSGAVRVDSSTDLQAFELLFRRGLLRNCGRQFDFVLGWRYARLDESLRIAQSSEWTQPQGLVLAGTTKELFDLFDTSNRFHGAELGILFHENAGPWSLDLAMKLALGNTQATVYLDGETITTVPGAGSDRFTGGLLAQETNVGRYEQDHFAVIPELGITVGYNITCRLRATFGYTLVYWSKVARPGDQLDLDVSQLPPEQPAGAHRPGFSFITSDYWAQGMNLGLEYRF